jgi:hypothetical protein
MAKLQTISENYSRYKYGAKLASTLFDFKPRGNLPQIMEQIRAAEELAKTLPDSSGTGFESASDQIVIHNLTWNNYIMTKTVYCNDVRFPANLTDALNRIGFFEGVGYTGNKTVDRSNLDVDVLEKLPSGVETPVEFTLTLRLHGGHIFLEDGTQYTKDMAAS